MSYLSVEVRENLHYIGVNDRETALFEGMWPLPNGIAYNSYVLTGEKTALLDTVLIDTTEEFLENLDVALDGRDLDYLIVHHMEPDHSGSITSVVNKYPNVKLVGNRKTKDLLDAYFDLEGINGFSYEEDFIEVKEGDKLDLGDTSLTFYMTPMVHWPESMVSFEESTGTLFSQDAFGSFGTLDGAIFDDQTDPDKYYDEIARYYSNIIGKYSKTVQNALNKLSGLDIKMICPVHGLVWREDPGKILQIYSDLANQKTKKGVLVIYGSMYGSTKKMAELVARTLAEKGVEDIKVFDISKTHMSYLLSETWQYEGIILGACSYNNKLFPLMKDLTERLIDQKMADRKLGIFGSYSWSGGAHRELSEFAEASKYDTCPTRPEIKGSGNQEDRETLRQLASEMADKILS